MITGLAYHSRTTGLAGKELESGADPEIFLRGGPESKLCKMKGIHS